MKLNTPLTLAVATALVGTLTVGVGAAASDASPEPAAGADAANAAQHSRAKDILTPKVMVVTMFDGEAAPWLENRSLDEKIAVPGLSANYPEVSCDGDDLCMMTTDMGYANAASSVTALLHSERFDLRNTYFLVSGIAGVDPADGTLGSAHWARYVVDGGLRHEIDDRQIPEDWTSNVLALGAERPGEEATWGAGTEVYRLNEQLVSTAFELTKDVELSDGATAQAYRQQYPAPANRAPFVSICDTVSSDTYWHGSLIGAEMQDWASLLTDGGANYCTTQMEDNATLTSLKRGADAGLVDFDRVAVMRTASNFDREAPGQSAAESLSATSGGFGPAVTNAYRTTSALAEGIIDDWRAWKNGVPQG